MDKKVHPFFTSFPSLPPGALQNTYVDMAQFGPYVDKAMSLAGIKPMEHPIPVALNRR